jgi:hypothetical protein
MNPLAVILDILKTLKASEDIANDAAEPLTFRVANVESVGDDLGGTEGTCFSLNAGEIGNERGTEINLPLTLFVSYAGEGPKDVDGITSFDGYAELLRIKDASLAAIVEAGFNVSEWSYLVDTTNAPVLTLQINFSLLFINTLA